MDKGEAIGGLFAVFFFLFIVLIFLVIVAGIYVITSIVYSKVFEKAGREKKLAWIPFYREYILVEVAELNWYWIILIYAPVLLSILTSWIPLLGLISTLACGVVAKVASVNLYYNVNKKFRCEDVYLLLYILLPALIPLGMMGFSEKYKYYAEQEVSPDGFLGDLGFVKSKKMNTNTGKASEPVKEEQAEVIKEEETKVTKEEVKETKKEVVKEAKDVEEKPKKKTTKKKSVKKDE